MTDCGESTSRPQEIHVADTVVVNVPPYLKLKSTLANTFAVASRFSRSSYLPNNRNSDLPNDLSNQSTPNNENKINFPFVESMPNYTKEILLNPTDDSRIPLMIDIQSELASSSGQQFGTNSMQDESIFSEDVNCTQAFLGGDFAYFNERAQHFIRRVWNQRWGVVRQTHLPKWMQDNIYLLKWHRPELKSFRACFNSIIRLHSETGNIWTHLLGCVAFLAISIVFFSMPSKRIQLQEKIVYGIFFIGAFTCLGLSFLFHTVFCHSEKVGKIFNKLDYCGIAFLTMGSFVPFLRYSFYCNFLIFISYLITILVLGTMAIIVSLFDKFASPRYRPVRAIVFILLGLFGIAPAAHFLIVNGWTLSINDGSLGWLCLMAVLYITGATIYAVQVPERCIPGKTDLICQSHQIFHIFVVIAAFVHYHGINTIANYRLTRGDCPLQLIHEIVL